jgi:hypothetical protein
MWQKDLYIRSNFYEYLLFFVRFFFVNIFYKSNVFLNLVGNNLEFRVGT